MNRQETIEQIKAFLQKQYAAYLYAHFDNRLILTSRNELMQNINGMLTSELEEALVHLLAAGDITDDNGIMIAFAPEFIFDHQL